MMNPTKNSLLVVMDEANIPHDTSLVFRILRRICLWGCPEELEKVEREFAQEAGYAPERMENFRKDYGIGK